MVRDYHAVEAGAGAGVGAWVLRDGGGEGGYSGTVEARRGGRLVRVGWRGGEMERSEPRVDERWLFFEADRGMEAVDGVLSVGSVVGEVVVGGGDEGGVEIEVGVCAGDDGFVEGLFEGVGPSGEAVGGVVRGAEGYDAGLARFRGLVEASDAYLVDREVGGERLKTVLAGYPWFADWGRDTMIALPGLMLVCGRFGEAMACLSTFAAHVDGGMIPNRFDDYGGEPHYNTVDASLWFVHAAAEYLRTSGDEAGYRERLLPACPAVIGGYRGGTRYSIGVDGRDGLVVSGTERTQLTWMDAKRGGVVFTPRHGKAVEVNALWWRALRATGGAMERLGVEGGGALLDEAGRVGSAFRGAFCGGPGGGLHDCLLPDGGGGFVSSGEVRVNQVFAVSLGGEGGAELVGEEWAGRVVELVGERLWTPRGMRTLEAGAGRYRAFFEGGMMSRDDAYHNGTAWPWLVGAYGEAVLRVGGWGEGARSRARGAVAPLVGIGRDGGVGQIAEVVDGEERWGWDRAGAEVEGVGMG